MHLLESSLASRYPTCQPDYRKPAKTLNFHREGGRLLAYTEMCVRKYNTAKTVHTYYSPAIYDFLAVRRSQWRLAHPAVLNSIKLLTLSRGCKYTYTSTHTYTNTRTHINTNTHNNLRDGTPQTLVRIPAKKSSNKHTYYALHKAKRTLFVVG